MAVAAYRIYLDNQLVASVPAPLTQDAITGLPPGSLHLVEVSAVDQAGNESARSSFASFLVPPDVVVEPPDLPRSRARVFAAPQTIESPQLAFPYRFGPDGFVLDEDGTLEELKSVAAFTLFTPPGWRAEAPGIGTPDAAFTLHPGRVIAGPLAAADERIGALVSEERDALEEQVVRLLIQIRGEAA
jgi:hypothetical protein